MASISAFKHMQLLCIIAAFIYSCKAVLIALSAAPVALRRDGLGAGLACSKLASAVLVQLSILVVGLYYVIYTSIYTCRIVLRLVAAARARKQDEALQTVQYSWDAACPHLNTDSTCNIVPIAESYVPLYNMYARKGRLQTVTDSKPITDQASAVAVSQISANQQERTEFSFVAATECDAGIDAALWPANNSAAASASAAVKNLQDVPRPFSFWTHKQQVTRLSASAWPLNAASAPAPAPAAAPASADITIDMRVMTALAAERAAAAADIEDYCSLQ